MPSTPRLALPYPAGTDPADVPADLGALAGALDGAALDDQGLLADRPVSTPGSPGLRGRYWYATDTGLVYRDHGTGWTTLNPPDRALGHLGHAQVTADQTGIKTETDLTGLTVAAPVGAARRIKVSCCVHIRRPADASPFAGLLYIKEGAAYLGGARIEWPAQQNMQMTVTPYVILTPSQGVHTYKLALVMTGGDGTTSSVGSIANVNFPAFLLVEDIGPAA